MKKLAVVINPKDNVATAVQDLNKGQEVNVDLDGKIVKVNLLDDIPFGHKFALMDIDLGKEIIKYGEVIGKTTRPIKTGEHVHVHNFESLRGRGDWEEEGR
ncbi:MAG: altronate dehydratase small subunit [Tepidanaerobacteraceae bacterium]|nr:altronate dehydratase small subunit [Tepidanaerobacteraceae bacterium]